MKFADRWCVKRAVEGSNKRHYRSGCKNGIVGVFVQRKVRKKNNVEVVPSFVLGYIEFSSLVREGHVSQRLASIVHVPLKRGCRMPSSGA